MLLAASDMAPTLAIFAMLLITGLLVLFLLPMQLRREKERVARWRAWAAENRFRFEEPGGPWYRKTPSRIVGEVNGLSFVYDRQVVSTGKSHVVYTRLVVHGPPIVPGKLKIIRNHFFNRIGFSFRSKRIETGDPVFDAMYLVSYRAADATGVTLNERTRELLCFLPRLSDLTIEQGKLTLRWIATTKETTTLDQGLAAGLAPWLGAKPARR